MPLTRRERLGNVHSSKGCKKSLLVYLWKTQIWDVFVVVVIWNAIRRNMLVLKGFPVCRHEILVPLSWVCWLYMWSSPQNHIMLQLILFPSYSLLRSRLSGLSRNAPPKETFFRGSVAWHPQRRLRRWLPFVRQIENRKVKQAMFWSHGREPGEKMSHIRTILSPRLLT